MNMIAALDSRNGIGKNGALLFPIPEDLKRFKELTTGKAVVMGYQTLLSLPKSRPLPNRTNFVLTHKTIEIESATVCRSTDELFRALRDIPSRDVFVIGGESVYRLLLPYCDTLYLTKIHAEFEADKYFPFINGAEWTLVQESERFRHLDTDYQYLTYERKGNL